MEDIKRMMDEFTRLKDLGKTITLNDLMTPEMILEHDQMVEDELKRKEELNEKIEKINQFFDNYIEIIDITDKDDFLYIDEK